MTKSNPDFIDSRLTVTLRLFFASVALPILNIDPPVRESFLSISYVALALYAVYATTLYLLVQRRGKPMRRFQSWSHWADVLWFTALVALSGGTNSIFYFGFFFSVLVASFRHGFTSGVRVTFVSVFLFTVVGLTTASIIDDLDRLLLRLATLLIIGYMISYWGGLQIILRRRLMLIGEVGALASLRGGVNITINSVMKNLLDFYDADTCLFITEDAGSHHLYRLSRHAPKSPMSAEQIAPELARLLLHSLPITPTLHNSTPRWLSFGPSYYLHDSGQGKYATEKYDVSEMIAATTDAKSFISAPLRRHSEVTGRLFVTSRRFAFDASDADFLAQVTEQVTSIIDNIRLVDRLSSVAAEDERKRIARDIHDSVIQPYIGIHMGLSAIQQKLAGGGGGVSEDVERLIEVTGKEVMEMRLYIHGLRDASEFEGSLLPAVRRFATKYSEATGITVQVESDGLAELRDEVATEALQMVVEGLSNIRRHTQAARARVNLSCRDRHLVLRIENDNVQQAAAFTPRSITERAAALGGEAYVERRKDGATIVNIEVPL